MSEFYIVGRNDQTNKSSVLNIDDNGKLKLDESGKLTDIELNTDTTNTRLADTNTKLDSVNSNLTGIDGLLTTIDADTGDIRTLTGTSANSLTALETDLVDRRINLQYQRSLGNCYIATDERRLTADRTAFYSILNPTGSGKTMYVYGISCVISDHEATNIGGNINFEGFLQSNYTAGANANDGKNMKVGEADSPMIGNRDSTITGRIPYFREAFSFSTSTIQELFQFERNMTHDMLEVPAGYGVCFSYLDDTGATTAVDYGVSIRFCLL
jgi:hypothetical protein